MKKIAIFLFIGLSSVFLKAQNPNGNFNPFVEDAIITPSPLIPLENGGRGELSFSIGNNGTDPLKVYSDHFMILTITLSNAVSELEDPISVISGTSAGYFSWSYNAGTYTGVQVIDILPNSVGEIKIAFEVAKNSSSPGSNGFNVNITPSPYQTSTNKQEDDAVSTYTYTEEATLSEELDVSAFSIFPNPSDGEIILNLDRERGDFLLEVISPNGSIVNQDVLHWQGVPLTLDFSELTPGLYQIHLSNGENSFQEKLIIVK